MFGEKATSQIPRGLDSHQSEEPLALDYLQRLNLGGYDVKGQLSTSHGQAGIGVSLSAGVDFGALLIPFVHLELGVKLGAEGTADALLMLQRMPHRLWADAITQPRQAPKADRKALLPTPFVDPYWTSRTPLARAFLRGKTFRLAAGAFARAWAGAGTFEDQDETGATLGAAIVGDAGATMTRLIDAAARHYPATPSDSTLGNDIDDLFEANLKAKAAAWLLGTGGGVKDLMEFGAPQRLRKEQLQDAGVRLDKVVLKLAAAYDELTIPDVDSQSTSGLGVAALKALHAAGRKVRDAIKGNQLTTAILLAELAGVQRELTAWTKVLAEAESRRVYGSRTCEKMAALATRRLEQAQTLTRALERRQANMAPWAPPTATAVSPGQLSFSLDITALEASGGISASAKLVLPRDTVKLQVATGAEAQLRRNVFRYQAWTPGPPARALRWTQDTVVTYVSRRVFAEGTAHSSSFSNERPNLVTMSYRSVLAQWFDNPVLTDAKKALPNGSGVSFGMSVLPQSFADYARCCKYAKDDPGNRQAVLDEGLKALEAALMKQLRVGVEDLRKFMRNAPSSLGEVFTDVQSGDTIESYLVESAFALKAPLLLEYVDASPPMGVPPTPKDLFKLPAVDALIKNGTTGQDWRLQSIRLRYRIQTGDDQLTSVLQLGWNREPWGEDSGEEAADSAKSWLATVTGFDASLPNWLKLSALAIELGIEIESIRRVGSEGVVDLHTQLYPDPYSHDAAPGGYGRDLARKYEALRWRELTDMLVPSVALFRQ